MKEFGPRVSSGPAGSATAIPTRPKEMIICVEFLKTCFDLFIFMKQVCFVTDKTGKLKSRWSSLMLDYWNGFE